MVAALDLTRNLLNSGNPQMARMMLVQYKMPLTRAKAAQLPSDLALLRDALSQ